MRAHEFESQDLPSVERARRAIPQILARAQRDYDAWDEMDRDTYAGGGICHIIADSVCDVLSDAGIECTSVSCSHEQHVYVAARFSEGVYTIDIPYHIYEQGGGFSWKKLPDVRFEPRDVVFYRVSGDPADWRDYLDEGMRDVVNFVRNIGSERDAPIVMMTNPQNTGARTASGQRMRIEDFPLKTVAVSELRPWEPMIKMRDLPSQRTVASLVKTLQQGGRIPPLLVTPVRGGYRIIDGHHRYAALQRAGIERCSASPPRRRSRSRRWAGCRASRRMPKCRWPRPARRPASPSASAPPPGSRSRICAPPCPRRGCGSSSMSSRTTG